MALIDTKGERVVFELIFYLLIGIFVLFMGTFSGFPLKGFQESFTGGFIEVASYLGIYLIYMGFMIIALFIVIFAIMNYIFIKPNEHPSTQTNPGWLRIFTVDYIYNPEDSLLGSYFGLKASKILNNILRVSAVSIIFFGFIGIMHLFFPKLAFAGVPNLQQITPTSDVIFGSLIPAFAENGMILFVFFLLLGLTAFLCAKFIKDKQLGKATFFTTAFLIVTPIVAFLWMKYHSLTYGNSEISLVMTFVFAVAGLWLTLVFGIFLPFFIFHFMNNFFIKLSELATVKEDLILISLIIWVLFTVSYVALEWLLYKRRKRTPESAITG